VSVKAARVNAPVIVESPVVVEPPPMPAVIVPPPPKPPKVKKVYPVCKEKLCPGCGETKPGTEFYRAKHRSSGTQARCKLCWRPYITPTRTRYEKRWSRGRLPDGTRVRVLREAKP
jgi:hypothetical protein